MILLLYQLSYAALRGGHRLRWRAGNGRVGRRWSQAGAASNPRRVLARRPDVLRAHESIASAISVT